MSDLRRAVPALILPVILLAGCQANLATMDFLRRYEEHCAVAIERDGYRFILLYQSPEYLAARTAGPGSKAVEIDSLSREYGRAHYVRISIRPAIGEGGEAGAAAESDPLLPHAILAHRLTAVQGGLSQRIRLRGSDGEAVEPISAAFQKGLKTGASNTILAIFPLESKGKHIDLEHCDLEIEDLGLNLGTLRNRLILPKGFRLKVDA